MRAEFALGLACALGAGFFSSAGAQVSTNLPPLPTAPIITRGGGIGGTGLGVGAGAGGVQTEDPLANRAKNPLAISGQGHLGAGTGGLGLGMGNASGGVNDLARVGVGGIRDTTVWGSATGGILDPGRGLGAGSGGIRDTAEAGMGINTGGVVGGSTGRGGLGAGSGGIRDQTSLGASTGGFREGPNAPRFRSVQ